MNFSPQVKAWLRLITLVVSSGTAIGMGAFLSGSPKSVAIVLGIGAAATNVFHALTDSPKDAGPTNPPTP